MRWKLSEAKGSGTDYIGYAETTPLSEAVRDLWRKYLADAAPLNAVVAWDYLGIYIYLDSGRVILFPVVSTSRFRVEKSACQIICPDLLASYEEVADSNMPDDEFETWAKASENKVVGLVSDAAKAMKLPERLGRPEVRVVYYSYSGDSGPIKEDLFRQG